MAIDQIKYEVPPIQHGNNGSAKHDALTYYAELGGLPQSASAANLPGLTLVGDTAAGKNSKAKTGTPQEPHQENGKIRIDQKDGPTAHARSENPPVDKPKSKEAGPNHGKVSDPTAKPHRGADEGSYERRSGENAVQRPAAAEAEATRRLRELHGTKHKPQLDPERHHDAEPSRKGHILDDAANTEISLKTDQIRRTLAEEAAHNPHFFDNVHDAPTVKQVDPLADTVELSFDERGNLTVKGSTQNPFKAMEAEVGRLSRSQNPTDRANAEELRKAVAEFEGPHGAEMRLSFGEWLKTERGRGATSAVIIAIGFAAVVAWKNHQDSEFDKRSDSRRHPK